MVLDGRTIIDKHIVSFPDMLLDNEIVMQPNGVDLRTHKIWQVTGRVALARDKKIETKELQMTEIACKNGYFRLDSKEGNYLVDFREQASIKDGYCAILIPRSSLLRSGVFVTSALWDTGFEGRLGGSIRVRNSIDIEYGAALAQLMVMQSEFNGQRYDGRYKNKDSQTVFNERPG